jgi:hypothetical protein
MIHLQKAGIQTQNIEITKIMNQIKLGENVTTLALGSQPKQKFTKVQAKIQAQESHFMLPRLQKSERMDPTLPNELPLWELES